jgi:hypothetical protein
MPAEVFQQQVNSGVRAIKRGVKRLIGADH